MFFVSEPNKLSHKSNWSTRIFTAVWLGQTKSSRFPSFKVSNAVPLIAGEQSSWVGLKELSRLNMNKVSSWKNKIHKVSKLHWNTIIHEPWINRKKSNSSRLSKFGYSLIGSRVRSSILTVELLKNNSVIEYCKSIKSKSKSDQSSHDIIISRVPVVASKKE